MASIDFISVSIVASAPATSRAGFGTPLFPTYTATWPERVRLYKTAAEVGTDFAVGSPELRAAQAFFGQSPTSKQLKIGRFVNKPTMKYDISALTPTSFPSTLYKVRVQFGTTDTTVSFTSDASPTDAEFAAGLVAALNAVPSRPYTATGAASPISVTATTAGAWFSIEVLSRATMSCELTQVDPGVATDLGAILAEDADWYALSLPGASRLQIVAAGAWVEANKKLYLPESSDTTIVTQALAAGLDVADALNTLNYTRSSDFLQFHNDPASFLTAALFGKCLRFNPGTETWALKSLAGVSSVKLTSTERNRLTSKGGNSYEEVFPGKSVTFGGGQVGGNWIDQIRSIDYMLDDIQKSVFDAMASVPKVGYTNSEVVIIENALRGALQRAAVRQIITGEFTIFTPRVEDQTTPDRGNRYFPGMTFASRLVGAVHSIEILGLVTP